VVDIVALPTQLGTVPDIHKIALERTGKSFYIAQDYDDLLKKIQTKPHPSLIIAPYHLLRSRLPVRLSEVTLKIPTIMLHYLPTQQKSAPSLRRLNPLNVIGVLNANELFTEKFGDVVTAFFDLRRELKTKTPITSEIFYPLMLNVLAGPTRDEVDISMLAHQRRARGWEVVLD